MSFHLHTKRGNVKEAGINCKSLLATADYLNNVDIGILYSSCFNVHILFNILLINLVPPSKSRFYIYKYVIKKGPQRGSGTRINN